MLSPSKPTIAITTGDPAGIGPELVLKSLDRESFATQANVVVVGSEQVLAAHAETIRSLPDARDLKSSWFKDRGISLEEVSLDAENFTFGKISGPCGKASYEYLQRAISLALRGKVDAIVTAPIHKESWRAGGVSHIGHTEALSEAFGRTGETVFVIDGLRIFFLTRHVSLRKAIELISEASVHAAIHRVRDSLQEFGIARPRIAVAALNPHGGDGGLFGDEEIRILTPAINRAYKDGVLVSGPFPADSVFHQCAEGEFDAVLSLFHDQGHIAAKMKSFHGTVAVTTGLPVVRTSVDHGTAFDIAGKDKANPGSLSAAIKLALHLVRHRSASTRSKA